MLFAITMSIAANAQNLESRKNENLENNRISALSVNPFYIRGGFNLNNVSEGDMGVGYEFLLGYRHNLGTKGAHFYAELGMNTRGWGDDNEMIHQLFFSPKFGWYASVSNKVKFEPHIGIFAGYDLAASGDYDMDDLTSNDDYNRFDYGYSVGFGVWVNNRWNFDIELKQGLNNVDDDDTKSHGWSFSVAYAF